MTTQNHPLLTHAQEKTLAREIEAGVLAREARELRATTADDADLALVERAGERAWKRLAGANVRLVWLVVVPVARRTGLDADDLFQEGFLGLLEAMQRYDHTRDARFATFALPWIRMRVSNASATNFGSIGLPARRARAWRRVQGVEARLAASLGRTPDDREIARESGDEPGVVRRLRAFVPPVALPTDADLARPDDGTPALPDGELARLVGALHPSYRAIIVRRFGLGAHAAHSLHEVAAQLGVSTSTVRRRERAALEILRGRAELLAA